MIIGTVLAIAALGLTVWAFDRYRRLSMVAKDPVRATGRLTKKEGKPLPTPVANAMGTSVMFWVHYEFKDTRGKLYPGKCQVTKELFDSIYPNSALAVVYDVQKPSGNCLEEALEHTKFTFLVVGLIGLVVTGLLVFLVVG